MVKENSDRLLQYGRGVLILIILMTAMFTFQRIFHDDELEAVHTAWKIAQGEVIYQDFFQHHHPFLYYLLVPIIVWGGEKIETLFVCRAVMLLIGLGTCYWTYRLANLIHGDQKVNGMAAVLLLISSVLFSWYGFQIRPDVPMVFLQMMAIYYYIGFQKSGKIRDLMYAAVGFNLAVLFLQKAVIVVSMVFGMLFVQSRIKWVNKAIFTGVFFAGGAIYATYLWKTGIIERYFLLNWVINGKMIWHPERLDVLYMGTVSFPLVISYCLGFWKSFFCPKLRSINILIFGLLGTMSFYPAPNMHYALPALPLMAVIGAPLLVQGVMVRTIFVRGIWLVGVVFAVFSYFQICTQHVLDKQLATIQYIMQVASPGDGVLDGSRPRGNLFRKDVDYFWFQTEPRYGLVGVFSKMTGYRYDPYEIVEQKKPKIICNELFGDATDPRISQYYFVSGVEGFLVRR